MKPIRAILADLETADVQPSAVILTAGLVAVEITDTQVIKLGSWYRRMKLDTYIDTSIWKLCSNDGRTISRDTSLWWDHQASEPFNEAWIDGKDRIPLELAMRSLDVWLQFNPYPIYGNGSDFDNAILQHAFRQFGLQWPYRRNRCLRGLWGTVQDMVDELDAPQFPPNLIKHHALHDAIHEADVLAYLLRVIEPVKCVCCGGTAAYKRRQNTAYLDEESNYCVLCEGCQVEADAYWQERWDEYYAGRL